MTGLSQQGLIIRTIFSLSKLVGNLIGDKNKNEYYTRYIDQAWGTENYSQGGREIISKLILLNFHQGTGSHDPISHIPAGRHLCKPIHRSFIKNLLLHFHA